MVVCKLLIYACFTLLVAGSASRFDRSAKARPVYRSIHHVLVLSAMVGFAISGLNFFLQAGSLADSGISGMWHSLFLKILWDSSVGLSIQLRLYGFALIFLILLIDKRLTRLPGSAKLQTWILGSGMLAAIVVIGWSFTVTGHTAEQALPVRIGLLVHLLGVGWWIGALWPLRNSCSMLTNKDLYQLMHRFGQQAVFVVTVLIFAGVFMAINLVEQISDLWRTTYGQVIVVKLLGVATILLIAGNHKIRMVPALVNHSGSGQRLKHSITLELAAGLFILSATAVLTTLTGPVQ